VGYDEETAERVRRAISRKHHLAEIKMFAGLCFMVNGNMCCGISDKALMIRVGAAAHEWALAQPHTRPMTMRGKSMGAFVLVDPGGYRTEAALAKWVQRGVDFVSTLPAKKRSLKTTRREGESIKSRKSVPVAVRHNEVFP
jgi:hypothetical protein